MDRGGDPEVAPPSPPDPEYWHPLPEEGPPGTSRVRLELVDPLGLWRAEVCWDGCIHLYRYYNVPYHARTPAEIEAGDDVDYVHVCDVDELLARLAALKAAAQAHFGATWNAD